MSIPTTMRQIRTIVTADGRLELSIATVDTPVPGPNEVLVRIEAAPINPSDLGLLLAAADVSRATSSEVAGSPVVTAPIPAAAMARLGARVGESMPVGNEGSGTVVAAGDSPDAQALLGRMVAMAAGASYSEYRAVPTMLCMALPEGTSAAAGASCFVNPLTALGMVETMRMEHHTALVHTAAASNLGQMLQRVCLADGVPLVNVVRRPEQVAILRDLGAEHVCDSSEPTFVDDLTAALIATGATLAFDATGGGTLAGRILSCMETAANAAAGGYSRYGSTVHKQAYIYGSLDRSPTELSR
ncbi:MAG: oxidase, partial [Acidimicrobiales bacterium]|nr:oxidase [Acidimicrobiales bacterium]